MLCQMLDMPDMQVSGKWLLNEDIASAGQLLLRERMLVIGTPCDWVNCPECGVELARVVRETAANRILLLCPECEEVTADRRLRETYRASPLKVVNGLLNGLGFGIKGMKVIEPEMSWNLGTSEDKPVTWYFARRLKQHKVAQRLRDQINLDRSAGFCRVITSSQLPLPDNSPLTGIDVYHLPDVARLSQSKFEILTDRIEEAGPQLILEATPGTTLKYVSTRGKVIIGGKEFKLSPAQKQILVALISDFDHAMENIELKQACNSISETFSPIKVFERKKEIYDTFIRFLPDEDIFQLIISEEDKGWLR